MSTPSDAPCLALFGGSFDPPHVGHVLAVHYVLLTCPIEQVLVIPTASHPFGKKHLPFSHRFTMTRLAFQHLAGSVSVLDMEARREGPSYSVDTVREIHRQYPDHRLEWIIGSDLLGELKDWRDIETLKKMVHFRVVNRMDEERGRGFQEGTCHLPAVSSSRLREDLMQGRDVSDRLPRSVAAYIATHNLYGEEKAE